MELQTKNLNLILQTPEQVLARIEAMSPADRAEVSEEWVARARAMTTADPWVHGFAVVHRGSGDVVGSGAYKGPPGEEGVVEIAYGVNEDCRGKGYATEVAMALVDYALESGRVSVVCAQTLPEKNASTRVLTKCGFRFVGEVIDPEDGLVWRWELHAGPER